MNNTRNISYMLWDYMDIKKEKKLSIREGRIYNWLNKDNLNAVILDNDIFWFEKTNSLTVMPNYIYDWLIKFYEKKGYEFIYKKYPV